MSHLRDAHRVCSHLLPVGEGVWETECAVRLWPGEPVAVCFAVLNAPDGPSSATALILGEIAASLGTLWPAIEAELLGLTQTKHAWELLSRLERLSVEVHEGSAGWTVHATFSGARLAGTSFFVDIEGGAVVGATACD